LRPRKICSRPYAWDACHAIVANFALAVVIALLMLKAAPAGAPTSGDATAKRRRAIQHGRNPNSHA
jgi:hypothetical protein